MKKLKKLLRVIIIYFLCAFIGNELNPMEWVWYARLVLVIWVLLFLTIKNA